MKIHHIGYLVRNMEEAVTEFTRLGYCLECVGGGTKVYDPLREINILFMSNGEYRIELVEAMGDASDVAGMVKRMGSSPYHVCYECEDLTRTCGLLRERGYVPMGEVKPAVALGGRKVCFLYGRQMGLVELLEI